MDIYGNISNFVNSNIDSRVSDWFLMSSPWATISIIMVYLAIVIQGPKIMESYQPFDLKSFIIIYNFCLVILSAFLLYEFLMSSWTIPGFSLLCQPMDYSDNPSSLRLAGACWWYYFSKLIELMDTIFFVLRKKNTQISFLHVYHHSTMPFLWWVGVRFVGGGEAYFSATINSFIHILMYMYYMLSAMGPAVQPYLWWKKYMTKLQLAQFWLVLAKTVAAICVDCGYPVGYEYFLVLYMLSHIALFSNFYYKTYHQNARHKREDTKHQPENNNSHEPQHLISNNGQLRERR